WDFVECCLGPRETDVEPEIGVADVERFLAKAPAARFPTGRWTDGVTLRVARGLLAALRDFGLLRGAVRKRLAPVYLPVQSFAFLAMVRQGVGIPARSALSDSCWRLFRLTDTAVEHLFIEAHQRGLLSYLAAGSVVRIQFLAETLEGHAHALTE